VNFEIVPAGDATLLVQFDERIDRAISGRVVTLASRLRSASLAGILDVIPTYRSVAVSFDPLRTDRNALFETLSDLVVSSESDNIGAGKTIDVPVCYGGEWGPDLLDVARAARLTEREVVARHMSPTYRVFMLGFVPGFAYLGTLDERIAVPRRTTPRTRVPAGSVAIAGSQTGIYPLETPGGWQIIGRTSFRPFDLAREYPSLLNPGDTVRFHEVDTL
jgi:KipI family sensor histidine kinase inhibitor